MSYTTSGDVKLLFPFYTFLYSCFPLTLSAFPTMYISDFCCCEISLSL